MFELPDKVRKLIPYEPERAGETDIRLDANESFVPLPAALKAQLDRALAETAVNRYPDPAALELRRAAAARYGVGVGNITAGNGSDELIAVILSCLLNKGGRLLHFAPDFSMYPFYAGLYELKSTVLSRDPARPFDMAAVIKTVRENQIDCVIFSNPCNPTSLGIDCEQVRALIEQTDALIVVDEAYMDFWDEAQSLARDVGRYDNLIVLRTCSKAFGLAGARLGFALAGPEISRTLAAVKSPYNVNALSQALGRTLLAQPQVLDEAVRAIRESVRKLGAGLAALATETGGIEQVYPTCANFVYLRMKDARAVYRRLRERGIVVRLMDGHLRISAGNETENAALLSALREILR